MGDEGDGVEPLGRGEVVRAQFAGSTVRELEECLFAPGSAFMARWHASAGSRELSEEAWSGARWSGTRRVRYQACATPWSKPSSVLEEMERTLAGARSVTRIVQTFDGGVPFSDCFSVVQQWVVDAGPGPAPSLRVSWDVAWTRRPPLVAGLVGRCLGVVVRHNATRFERWLRETLAGAPPAPPNRRRSLGLRALLALLGATAAWRATRRRRPHGALCPASASSDVSDRKSVV